MRKNKQTCVRTTTVELFKPDDEQKARWYNLAEHCQSLSNHIWRRWLCWHTENETPGKIRAHLAAWQSWQERHKEDVTRLAEALRAKPANDGMTLAEARRKVIKNGAKYFPDDPPPVLGVYAMPAVLDNLLYHSLAKSVPDINLRPLVLLKNLIKKSLDEKKAAKSSLPGWWAILLDQEAVPSFTQPQPIPFDKRNASILPPEGEDEPWRLKLRIDRIDRDGKQTATSTLDVVRLKTPKNCSQLAVLQNIATGKYTWKGSKLIPCQRKGKWFAALSYSMPAGAPAVQSDRVLLVRPMQEVPFAARVLGERRRIMLRTGAHALPGKRRHLLAQRLQLSDNHKVTGTNTKGRGRGRATRWMPRLEHAWRDFVKSMNFANAKRVIDLCREKGCGKVLYLQPMESARETCYCWKAGKSETHREMTGWDFAQMGKRLADLCQESGVKFELRKVEPRGPKVRAAAEGPELEATNGVAARNGDGKANGATTLQKQGRSGREMR